MHALNFNLFAHTIFLAFIALFPVINPIGCSFIVNRFFDGVPQSERKKMVRKVTLYVFMICVVVLFSGKWIMELFGISIPVVQIGGGLLICKMAWDALADKQETSTERKLDPKDVTSNVSQAYTKLLYPIAFPISAGGGTISVLFTLSAHASDVHFGQYLLNTLATLISVIVVCVIIYVMYLNTDKILQRVGTQNQAVVNRVFAFLTLCVGLQIATSGVLALIK